MTLDSPQIELDDTDLTHLRLSQMTLDSPQIEPDDTSPQIESDDT